MRVLAVAAAAALAAEAKEIVTFDGDKANFQWITVNDPVMGGQSSSSVSVAASQAVWTGEVKIVPFLQAPGFCNLQTRHAQIPDITGSEGLSVRVKAPKTSGISKFSVQLETEDGVTSSGRQISYSADFDLTADGEYHDHEVKWDDFKGTWRGQSAHGPALKTQLAKINQLGLSTYAAHTAAKFELDIQSISSIDSEEAGDINDELSPEPEAQSPLTLWAMTKVADLLRHAVGVNF